MSSNAHKRWIVVRLLPMSRWHGPGWYEWKRFQSWKAARAAADSRPCIDHTANVAIIDSTDRKVAWFRKPDGPKEPRT